MDKAEWAIPMGGQVSLAAERRRAAEREQECGCRRYAGEPPYWHEPGCPMGDEPCCGDPGDCGSCAS